MSKFSQETVRASTAQAFGCGTGDTNLVSLQLYLVANMSTWGQCQVWHRRSNISWWRDHSVWIIWPWRDNLSAITFRRPGMCLAFRTCLRLHQHRSLHRRAQSEPDLIPPSLFMYATTVVLSVATRTTFPCTMCWKLFNASNTAFSSRKFICSWLSGTDQVPLAVKSPKWAPQPSFEASVNIWMAWRRGCRGWPDKTFVSWVHQRRCGWRALGTGISFSSDSGFLQCLLRCHWMGVMWNLPRGTCFSVAVRRPIRDINFLTWQVWLDRRDPTFFWSDSQRSWVGLTSPCWSYR